MGLRLRHQFQSALRITTWLEQRPEVRRVMYPPLPSDPGHALWARDYAGGGCGLFGVELRPVSDEAIEFMLDGYEVFSIGFSWGGFESLVVPSTGRIRRTAKKWSPQGPTLRYHVGLEDVDDLLEDLEHGFERLNAFSARQGTGPNPI